MATYFSDEHLWLLDLLFHREEPITKKEIDAQWSVSKLNVEQQQTLPRQTFVRWCKALENKFGIRIACDRHSNAYYIAERTKVFSNPILSWLIRSVSISNFLKDIKDSGSLNRRIDFDNSPMVAPYFEDVITAMQSNQKIEIEYCRFESGTPYLTSVSPYGIKQFRKRWYVLGPSSHHNGEVRIFGLDRIRRVEILTENFAMPDDFDILKYFDGIFGVYLTETREMENSAIDDRKIYIRANSRTSDYWRTLPLHKSQKLEGPSQVINGEQHYLFSFDLRDPLDPDFVRELYLWGAGIRVLKPQALAEKIADSAQRVLELYRK